MYRRYFFTFVIMVLLCAGCISCGVQADTADESAATESDVSTLISGSAADCDVIRELSFDGYSDEDSKENRFLYYSVSGESCFGNTHGNVCPVTDAITPFSAVTHHN